MAISASAAEAAADDAPIKTVKKRMKSHPSFSEHNITFIEGNFYGAL